jgi:predicted peptidase
MGGMGTFEAVARYPGLFAAAVPICGGGDVRAYSIKEPYTPMRIFHGSADSVVDVKYSWEMFDALKQLTWPVEYIEYPMVDHNSWDFAFAEKDFLAWLFAKKKGK